VQDFASYEPNLGPVVRDPSELVENFCSYIDVYDLADATVLALEAPIDGHEVVYIASPDTIGGHPLEEIVRRYHGARDIELRKLPRPDASAIDSSKARRLLGWKPQRSWSDYLDRDGKLKKGAKAPW
jgi:nucleoside-diphosphate-sugar epimerase